MRYVYVISCASSFSLRVVQKYVTGHCLSIIYVETLLQGEAITNSHGGIVIVLVKSNAMYHFISGIVRSTFQALREERSRERRRCLISGVGDILFISPRVVQRERVDTSEIGSVFSETIMDPALEDASLTTAFVFPCVLAERLLEALRRNLHHHHHQRYCFYRHHHYLKRFIR